MKIWYFIVGLILCGVSNAAAQDVSFSVEVTTDTLLFGNKMGIKYTIKNAQGDFDPPDFSGFYVVGGPNVSSQFEGDSELPVSIDG